MILTHEEGKLRLNPPPPVYSLEDHDGGNESSTGQDAESSRLSSYDSPRQSTFTSYYAASPAGSSLASTSAHPAFSRPPASGLPYQAFKPTYLAARGKSLEKGFPMIPPPSEEVPHLFVTHDVHQDDWLQCVCFVDSHKDRIIYHYYYFLPDSFLDDLRMAGSLTQKDISRSHLPIISFVPIVSE